MSKIIARALTDTTGGIVPYDGAAEGEFLRVSGGKLVGAAPPPAGSSGEVQFNSGGAFGGASETKVLAGGNLSHGIEQRVAAISDPAAAPSGALNVYGTSVAKRELPAFRSSLGRGAPLQPAIFARRVAQFYASGTASPATQTVGGWAFSTVGTESRQGVTASTTAKLRAGPRVRYVTTAAADQGAGIYASVDCCMRGNAAGVGGFFFYARFGNEIAPPAGSRFFVGLTTTTTTASVVGGDPSAMTNFVGLAKNAADTNYRLKTRAAGTVTDTDLGLAPAANDLLDVALWAEPNGSSVSAWVYDVAGGSVLLDATYSTNLPGLTSALRAHVMGATGTGLTALNLCVCWAYLETEL